jgi:hypothetical protein
MGHEDRTTSTISFNAATRTFTIAPVSTSFTVWCKGKKVVVSSAQTVTIPNTSGMHSIYYDANGTLSSKLGYFTFSTEAPTAYVYWNATTGAAPYFGDERHGVVLDWQTHEYLHRTRGAAIANGFLASGYTLNNSATNAATQIAIESGTFFDEDMKIDIVSTATPTAGTYQQNLLFPAKIPVLHLQGTSWVMDAPTDFPFKQGTSRPQYNSVSGGVWSTADVGNNQHATTWILATNNLTYPVIAIIGQSATDNLGEAEAFSFADLTLTGFPSVEFRPLYKLIYKASDGYANSVNAQLVSIVDLRSISAVGSVANPATDHGNLSGLTDDDHPQYLSVDTVRGTLTAAVKASFLPSQAGNAGKFLTTDATSTSWAALTSGNITTALGFTPYNATNPAGYITGITSSDVTTALGFTPYNATNPSGFVTAAGARGAISVTGAGSYDSATGVINIVGGVTSFNTRTGAITLSSADVTGALGFTPYNSTNPSGYITSSALSSYLPLAGGTVTGPVTIDRSSGGTEPYIGLTVKNTTTSAGIKFQSNSRTYEIQSGSDGVFLIYDRTAEAYRFTINSSGTLFQGNSANVILHAGNYNSYSPTLTGGGASGTWGISITGNSGTATKVTRKEVSGYLWDGTTLTPYWTKIGRVSGDSSMMVSIYASTDSNYSSAQLALATFKSWSGGSISAQLDSLTAQTLNIQVAIDNSGDCWIYANVAWSSFLRYNVEEQYNVTLYSSPAQQITTPTNSKVIGCGQGVRATYGSVTGASVYNTGSIVGDLTVRGTASIGGNTALHAGNYSSYALPLSGGTATNVTLGVRANNSVFGGNTSGMSAHSFTAEIRANGAKPTLTWHYEDVATRHVALDADGALNVYNPGETGGAVFKVGGNIALHAGNYTSYVNPKGGSWYGSGLPGSRWGGYAVSGGEISFGDGLPNANQMGILVDGCYVAGENNGFWSMGSDNTWGSRRGMYWDGTNLNFTTNSATASFSNALIGGNQVLHAGNVSSYAHTISTNPSNPGPGTLAIGNNGSYSFVQSHAGQALNLNPVGNAVNIAGNTAIHAGNYSSYALPLTGGTVSGLTYFTASESIQFKGARGQFSDGSDSQGIALFSNVDIGYPSGWGGGLGNTPTRGLSTWGGLNVGYGNSAGSTFNGTITVSTNLGSGNGVTPPSPWDNSQVEARSTDGSAAIVSLHRSGYSHAALIHKSTNSLAVNNNAGEYELLHAGNYTGYSPTLTGGSASGTWGISITGNSATVGGITPNQFFNNMGNGHSAYTDFNSVPGFGAYFVQQGGNSPTGVAANQWYGFTLGLGNEYALSLYGTQLYWPRRAQNGDTYIYVRDREGGSWTSWTKIRAGYADTAGSATTATDSSKLPLTGGSLSGNLSITPVPSSWAEGLAFQMPSTSTWGGLRWRRNRAGDDGNWYVGFTALDSSDDLVFGANNGGAQIDNILRMTKAGAVSTRGNTILHAGNFGSYALPLSGGTLTGVLTLSGNNYADFGPNSSWGATLRVGGNGHGGASRASVVTTNGNLHLDGTTSSGVYMSWYNSGSTGTYFGNGAGSQVGRIDGAGNGSFNGRFTVSAWTTTGRNYSNEWIEFGNHSGLYSPINGAHFYPNDQDYGPWRINGSRNGWNGLWFDTGSTLMMNSNEVGFHRTGNGWQMRWMAGTGYVHKGNPGGGTSAVILDSSNYTSYSPSLGGSGASGTWGINITGSAGSASTAGSLPTLYAGGQQLNPQVYFSSSVGLRVAMTATAGYWSDTLWINGYSGGDVLQMCALHTQRNGQPRMYISNQASNATSYGTLYEFLSTWNYSSYALPLTGGTVSGSTSFTSGSYCTYMYGQGNTAAVAGVGMNVYSGNGAGAIMAFHRGGYYAVNMGLDSDNVMRIGGWSAGANRWQLDMSGNGTYAGNVTAYSDERLKKDWAVLPSDFIAKLATVKSGTYTRIDSGERQAGSSAQDWQTLLPEVVSASNDEAKTLALAYGNAALVSAVELAKEVVDLRNRVAQLESLINKLIGD